MPFCWIWIGILLSRSVHLNDILFTDTSGAFCFTFYPDKGSDLIKTMHFIDNSKPQLNIDTPWFIQKYMGLPLVTSMLTLVTIVMNLATYFYTTREEIYIYNFII